MAKTFNIAGYCEPELNYMVDLTGRLTEIKAMVDAGLYFTINRARQFGKTTMIYMAIRMTPFMKRRAGAVSFCF